MLLRSLFISCFMTGSALSLIPVEKPPSSLVPQTGKVTFSHSSHKTIGCIAKGKGKELKCTPELTEIPGSASLTLRPIREKNVMEKDRRQTVVVNVSNPVEVPLSRGVWELGWTGRSERDRFFVAGGDEIAIVLSTQLGACKKNKDECLLVTDPTTLKVNIPKECRR